MNLVPVPQPEKEGKIRTSAEYLRRICKEVDESEHGKHGVKKSSVRKEPVSEGSKKTHWLVDINDPGIKDLLISEQIKEVLEEEIHDVEFFEEQNVKVPQQKQNKDALILELNDRCINLAGQAGQVKLLTDSEQRTREEYFKLVQENAVLKAKEPVLKSYIISIVALAIISTISVPAAIVFYNKPPKEIIKTETIEKPVEKIVYKDKQPVNNKPAVKKDK